MMYGGFAAVYDRLMADVDYEGWADYYLTLAGQCGVTVQRAADCACGTGAMTLAFARRGLQMTGVDLSADMLRLAAQKARERGLQVPFIRQDMRKLLLHRPMDALFCVCDGVNYLAQPEGAQAFFAAAYQAIRPGGGLFFDVSTEHKLAHTLGNNCLGDDGETVSYIWQNHYDAPSRTVQMDLTFFLRGEGGLYTRFGETHFQRAHSPGELSDWLWAAGFESVAVLGDRTFEAPAADAARMHIVAIRPQ